ncbi:unnamed protein product [Vitrella brassicaformis CCMP3155]|uniref:Protein kinase domain-containing protein n=4 Tax=Vitrella brassicaformis TaxID=1169539 RepID=A0A0G4GPA4_VITBC|nr:unnamed protein product [Vitrella brassicaformis CCMP3155]|eukprot:CEM32121.1 unnamed protein product [Vitrella brassicaformis CCMP3155]
MFSRRFFGGSPTSDGRPDGSPVQASPYAAASREDDKRQATDDDAGELPPPPPKKSIFGFALSSKKDDEAAGSACVENCYLYEYEDIRRATENWSDKYKLGQGTHGTVYAVTLKRQKLAVKRLLIPDEGGFLHEVRVLNKLRHAHIVVLMGWAGKGSEKLLVYELLPGGDVSRLLRARNRTFPWYHRITVAVEAACGLNHMHNAKPKIFHRDIKCANIILDRFGHAKLADFGLACLTKAKKDEVVVAKAEGTPGYACPHYIRTRKVTDKTEVYAFGMVLLELLTARPPAVHVNPQGGLDYLVRHINPSDPHSLLPLVDPRAHFPPEIKVGIAELALKCINPNDAKRPSSNEMYSELEQMIEDWCRTHPLLDYALNHDLALPFPTEDLSSLAELVRRRTIRSTDQPIPVHPSLPSPVLVASADLSPSMGRKGSNVSIGPGGPGFLVAPIVAAGAGGGEGQKGGVKGGMNRPPTSEESNVEEAVKSDALEEPESPEQASRDQTVLEASPNEARSRVAEPPRFPPYMPPQMPFPHPPVIVARRPPIAQGKSVRRISSHGDALRTDIHRERSQSFAEVPPAAPAAGVAPPVPPLQQHPPFVAPPPFGFIAPQMRPPLPPHLNHPALFAARGPAGPPPPPHIHQSFSPPFRPSFPPAQQMPPHMYRSVTPVKLEAAVNAPICAPAGDNASFSFEDDRRRSSLGPILALGSLSHIDCAVAPCTGSENEGGSASSASAVAKEERERARDEAQQEEEAIADSHVVERGGSGSAAASDGMAEEASLIAKEETVDGGAPSESGRIDTSDEQQPSDNPEEELADKNTTTEGKGGSGGPAADIGGEGTHTATAMEETATSEDRYHDASPDKKELQPTHTDTDDLEAGTGSCLTENNNNNKKEQDQDQDQERVPEGEGGLADAENAFVLEFCGEHLAEVSEEGRRYGGGRLVVRADGGMEGPPPEVLGRLHSHFRIHFENLGSDEIYTCVSRHHCRIDFFPLPALADRTDKEAVKPAFGFLLTNLSVNNSYLNGLKLKRNQKAWLQPNDIIALILSDPPFLDNDPRQLNIMMGFTFNIPTSLLPYVPTDPAAYPNVPIELPGVENGTKRSIHVPPPPLRAVPLPAPPPPRPPDVGQGQRRMMDKKQTDDLSDRFPLQLSNASNGIAGPPPKKLSAKRRVIGKKEEETNTNSNPSSNSNTSSAIVSKPISALKLRLGPGGGIGSAESVAVGVGVSAVEEGRRLASSFKERYVPRKTGGLQKSVTTGDRDRDTKGREIAKGNGSGPGSGLSKVAAAIASQQQSPKGPPGQLQQPHLKRLPTGPSVCKRMVPAAQQPPQYRQPPAVQAAPKEALTKKVTAPAPSTDSSYAPVGMGVPVLPPHYHGFPFHPIPMPPPGFHHLNEDMDLTRRSVGPPPPPPPPLPQSSQSFYMSSSTAHTATNVTGAVHPHMPVLLGDYRVVMHPHHPHHHHLQQQQQPGSSHLPSQYHAHHG